MPRLLDAPPLSALVALALALPPATTRGQGETIPVVTLTRDGPDRRVDLGRPFYLAGAADPRTTSVRAAFVRYSYPALGIKWAADPDRCRAIISELEASEARDVASWFAEHVPETTHLPAEWARPESQEGAAQFRILVSQPGFFRPGASFCVFLFEAREENVDASHRVRLRLEEHGRAVARCRAELWAPGSPLAEASERLHGPECRSPAGSEACAELSALLTRSERSCGPAALPGLERDLRAIAAEELAHSSLGAAAQAARVEAVWEGVLSRLPAVAEARHQPPNLSGWRHVYRPEAAVPIEVPVRDAGLGTLVAELLVHHGRLARARSSTGGWSYLSADGKVAIERLELPFDDLPMRATGRAAGASEGEGARVMVPLEARPSALRLPDSTLSLGDLLDFAAGRIEHGGRRLPIDRLFEALFSGTGQAPENQEAFEAVRAVAAQVSRLHRVAERGWLASGERAPAHPSGAAAYIDAALGRWLRHLLRGRDELFAAGFRTAHRMSHTPAAAAPAWPGFERFAEGDPLDVLEWELRSFVDAWSEWREVEATIGLRFTKLDVAARPVALVLPPVTVNEFHTAYFTPVVGYGLIPLRGGESTFMPFAGVQLFLFPNPVDEPMWTHGAQDWYRFLGAQIAVGLPAPSYGPDERFSGRPLLLGLVAHVLPYATLSANLALVDVRHSRLPGEVSQREVYPFFGAALQGNLFDLIRAQLGKSTASVVGAAK